MSIAGLHKKNGMNESQLENISNFGSLFYKNNGKRNSWKIKNNWRSVWFVFLIAPPKTQLQNSNSSLWFKRLILQ